MIKDFDNREGSKIGLSNLPTDKNCQRLRKNCRCLLCLVPHYHNPTGLQEEGKHCKGLPDTNVVFIEKRVDDNPIKKTANKFLKIGRIAMDALNSARNTIPSLFKDLVNKSKILYRAAIHRDSKI